MEDDEPPVVVLPLLEGDELLVLPLPPEGEKAKGSPPKGLPPVLPPLPPKMLANEVVPLLDVVLLLPVDALSLRTPPVGNSVPGAKEVAPLVAPSPRVKEL